MLQIYRDDGPLAAWVARRTTVPGHGRAGPRQLAWLVPPVVRLLEYGTLIALSAAAEPDALPFCFALLGVLAFHHYDTVYRLRHQRVPPPAWVRAVGGGWEGRLIVAGALALAGGLRIGLLLAATGLAVVYVTESVLSWLRFGRAAGEVRRDDEAEDDE
jgi:hypothetical protein